MERRDFFKRLGFAGAAIAVTPQILAEIKPDPPSPIAGADLTVHTPDGREIPCKSFTMDILERPGNGGIYLGDDCVFKIYDWSLEINGHFFDGDKPIQPMYKDKGLSSAFVNGSGVIVEEFIPFDTSALLRLVLFDQDNVYDAEGMITALSYGATIGEPIENAIEFQISGPITRTSRI